MSTDTNSDRPPTTARLRDGEPDDRTAIADILSRASREAYRFMAWPHTDRSFEEFVGDSMARWDKIRVAENTDGEIVGFLCLEGSLIDQLFVTPQHQKHGVGSLLLADAKRLHPKGLSLYTFQANKSARGFYEKRGFRGVAYGISEAEGEPDVTYVWAGDGRV